MSATTRRAVLGAGLAGGAAALASCTTDDEPRADSSGSPSPGSSGTVSSPPDPRHDDWGWVQEQFPLDPSLGQFAAFVLSPHPTWVQTAIDGYRAELGIDTEHALLERLTREDAVRAAAAEYAGGSPGQYALTDSTTMGLGLMYGGLTLRPGDEVLTTTHDFYSTEESLRLLADRTGARIRRVSLYDKPEQATVEGMVEALLRAMTPRTRVVAVT